MAAMVQMVQMVQLELTDCPEKMEPRAKLALRAKQDLPVPTETAEKRVSFIVTY